MEMKVNIPFNQLLTIIGQLTPVQKEKLKKVLDTVPAKNSRLKKIILEGPVFTDEQITAIEDTRKSINEWRRKL